MGHTNSTANLALPQFIGTDKPTWLGDINSAFSDIDAYAGTNDAAVSGAVADAASAVSQAASAVSTANAANTTAGNASTAATNAVGTANNAMSLVNQTNTKMGTLANLNTTDKTSIVNAINEVQTAAGTTYDNTGSGLTATNVQDAIDEVAQGSGTIQSNTMNVTSTSGGAITAIVAKTTHIINVTVKPSDQCYIVLNEVTAGYWGGYLFDGATGALKGNTTVEITYEYIA